MSDLIEELRRDPSADPIQRRAADRIEQLEGAILLAIRTHSRQHRALAGELESLSGSSLSPKVGS